MTERIEYDEDWAVWRKEFEIREDTIYLNHGSFGVLQRAVRDRQLAWQRELSTQPMDFFVRQYEPAWLSARQQLASALGASPDDLVFAENSTAAMNTVANSFPLRETDEVVLTDHEYGAVLRIWHRACRKAGAPEPRIAELPTAIESVEQVVDHVFAATTAKTRLLVVSHITSPTAIILPVRQIVKEAHRRGITVCVDGPHAPAQVPLSLSEVDCDFYTASLHKWVSAPIGSGFLHVAPKWQSSIRPPLLSWGRNPPAEPQAWWEEFVWAGTRDPSAWLTVPAAFDALSQVGQDRFRQRTHFLARHARQRLLDVVNLRPLTPDGDQWNGSMASVPLPPGDAQQLQVRLWREHGIEVPIIEHKGQRSIRVSCHLYTTMSQIDQLVEVVAKLLRDET